MPILLVFALIAACLPIDWPEPVWWNNHGFDSPQEPAPETALAVSTGAVGGVLLIAFALRTWVVRTLRRDPGRRIEVARVYGRARRALFFLNVSTAAACVLGFGWGWLVQHDLMVERGGKQVVAPFAELAVPLPYFVILVSCWFIYYDAERAMHGGRAFPPRFAYVLHSARQFALMVALPVGLVVTQQTLIRFAPELTRTDAYRLASLAAVPVLLLFMPLVMKPLLGLKSMPAGPIRARLESLARRLQFQCTDFLLWHTHGAAANALIAGLLPRVRYVVFTDRILEELPPDELDAVFGHEVGHAKHGHIWLYAGFLTLSLSMIAALLLFIGQQIDASGALELPESKAWLEKYKTWLELPPVVIAAGYLFVVFGALSRRCERQADVYGCKAVSCGNPVCTGHDEATEFPCGGKGLCPAGIRTFARALARVGDLNGLAMARGEDGASLGQLLRGAWAWLRAWQHGPMPNRIAFLMTLIDRPDVEARFQRRLFAFKCALVLVLFAALVALGEAVGWADLLEVL
jgi:STE24 endopeptidase